MRQEQNSTNITAVNKASVHTDDRLISPNGTSQAENGPINTNLSAASNGSDLIDDLLDDICPTDMDLLDEKTLEQYQQNGDDEPIPPFISAFERVLINLPNCMVTETSCNNMAMITNMDSLKPIDEDVPMNGEIAHPADAIIAQPTNNSPIQSAIEENSHLADKNTIDSLFMDPFFTAKPSNDISVQASNEQTVQPTCEPTNEKTSPVNEPNLSTKETGSISTMVHHLPQLFPDNESYQSSEDEFIADTMENTLPNSSNNCDINQKQQKCSLCGYISSAGWKVLSKHYVRYHPDSEMPTARLPKVIVPTDLEANPIESTATYRFNSIVIKSACLFCSCDYMMSTTSWLQHFVAHTGEYEYKCNSCQRRLIADVHKRCHSTKNIQVMCHELKDNRLFAFTCNKCNYTQLSKENLIKHIESHHQIYVSDDLITEIMLINCLEEANGYNDGEENDSKMDLLAHNFQCYDPIDLSSDEFEAEDNVIATENVIDLTLSDSESN